MLAIILSVFLLCCQAGNLSTTTAIGQNPIIRTGEDWSLPGHVEKAPYSAVFYMDRKYDASVENYITGIGKTFHWIDFNPAEGVYDFSLLNHALKEAEQQSRLLIIRLKCSKLARKAPWGTGEITGPYVPQWVLNKYNPPSFYTLKDDHQEEGNVNVTPDHFIKVVAFWNDGVQEEYKKFVEKFGKLGYFSNKNLAGVYVHGISSSFGEECWLKTEYATDARLNYDMDYQVLENAFKKRMDWWTEAAGSKSHKLAWVDFGWMGTDWKPTAKKVNDYALEKGMGWRQGGIELYNRYVPNRMPFIENNSGYFHVDWNHPLRKRYYGDEGENVYKDFAPNVTQHMVQSMLMKASILGMNFMWISPDTKNQSPAMMEWYSLTAGKLPAESPDAICWLREDYTRYEEKNHTWKNMERFIRQRDVEGYKTVPTEKLIRKEWDTDQPGVHFDNTARRTDVTNNQKGFLFQLDPEFSQSLTAPFEIKITYVDRSVNQWNVSLVTSDGITETAAVSGTADGKLKTATYSFNKIPYAGSDAYPIKINVASGGDLTIKYVRIIKQ